MSHQKVPHTLTPGALRPQAARLQPDVRNHGLRKVKKPKQSKSLP